MPTVNDPQLSNEDLFDLSDLPANQPVILGRSSVKSTAIIPSPQVKEYVVRLPEGQFQRFSVSRIGEVLRRHRTTRPGTEDSTVSVYGLGHHAGGGEQPQRMSPADDDLMTISREEIEAKLDLNQARLEATEARMEAKLEQAINEVRSSNAHLQASVDNLAVEMRTEFKSVPRTGAMVVTAASVALATIGTIVSVLAFGGDRFDGGVQMTSTSVEQALEAKRIGEQNADQLRALTTAVQSLATEIKTVSDRETPPPQIPPKQ